MLHAKFQIHDSIGAGEKKKIFTIYGHGGHIFIMWPISFVYFFISGLP